MKIKNAVYNLYEVLGYENKHPIYYSLSGDHIMYDNIQKPKEIDGYWLNTKNIISVFIKK